MVYIRIKPDIINKNSRKYIELLSNNVLGYYDHYSNTWKSYTFDHIFQPTDTQETVFSEYEHLSGSILEGYNICILAYGQTGSGKTYTMIGNKSNWGISFRIIKKIFDISEAKRLDLTMTLSMYEIYNEDIIDLLNRDPNVKLNIITTDGGTTIQNLSSYVVNSQEDILKYFSIGNDNRSTASTNIHEHSSRSHCIMTIGITYTDTSGKIITGKMSLVDLAGSENVQKSGVQGNRLYETQNINKSLSCLGEVINALDNKSKHIPYRNSKLTFSLKDALSPGSKTIMICTIRTLEDTWNETQSTLNFASRARNINLGSTKQMVEFKNMKEENTKLKKFVNELQKQLDELQIKIEQVQKEKENTIRQTTSDMAKRKRKVENELAQALKDISQLKSRTNDLVLQLESIKNEKNSLQSDYTTLSQKYAALEQKCRNLSMDNINLNLKCKDSETEVMKLKRTMSQSSSTSSSQYTFNRPPRSSSKISKNRESSSQVLTNRKNSTNSTTSTTSQISQKIETKPPSKPPLAPETPSKLPPKLEISESNSSTKQESKEKEKERSNNTTPLDKYGRIKTNKSNSKSVTKVKRPKRIPPSPSVYIQRSQTVHSRSVSEINVKKQSDEYYFNWLKTLPPTNTLTKNLTNFRSQSVTGVSSEPKKSFIYDIEAERTINLSKVDDLLEKLNTIISPEE